MNAFDAEGVAMLAGVLNDLPPLDAPSVDRAADLAFRFLAHVVDDVLVADEP